MTKKQITICITALLLLTGCESLTLMSDPVAIEAKEKYFGKEIYSLGNGKCIQKVKPKDSFFTKYLGVKCSRDINTKYVVTDVGNFSAFDYRRYTGDYEMQDLVYATKL